MMASEFDDHSWSNQVAPVKCVKHASTSIIHHLCYNWHASVNSCSYVWLSWCTLCLHMVYMVTCCMWWVVIMHVCAICLLGCTLTCDVCMCMGFVHMVVQLCRQLPDMATHRVFSMCYLRVVLHMCICVGCYLLFIMCWYMCVCFDWCVCVFVCVHVHVCVHVCMCVCVSCASWCVLHNTITQSCQLYCTLPFGTTYLQLLSQCPVATVKSFP